MKAVRVKAVRKNAGLEKNHFGEMVEDVVGSEAPEIAKPVVANEVIDNKGFVSLPQQTTIESDLGKEAEAILDESEDDDDLTPIWEVFVDGLPFMSVISTKFTVFDGNTCQVVCEFKAVAGVNAALFGWLQKPVERKIRIVFSDCFGEKIEQWDAHATPQAFAAGELELGSGEEWISTYQMLLKSIKIS